jgi:hypothetical protein
MLLAIDGNQRINRRKPGRAHVPSARRSGLQAGTSLWSIFDRDIDLFPESFGGRKARNNRVQDSHAARRTIK